MTAPLRKRRPFAVSVPVATLEDRRLSWRARGILVGLMGKPDGWDVRSDAIARDGKEGREAVRTALRELYAHGYIRIVRHYSRETGGMVTETELSDVPVAEWAAEYAQSIKQAEQSGKPWRAPVLRGVESHFLGSTFPDSSFPDSGNPGPLSSSFTGSPNGEPGTATQEGRAAHGNAPRACRIPDGWEPSAELWSWTAAKVAGTSVDTARELEQFQDFWRAKSGRDATKQDWDATWRTWIRNAIERSGRGPAGSHRPSTTDQRFAAGRALAEQYRREEAAA
jgi:hypothetical protein